MRFLVLGTILDKTAFSYNLAANPASTKWLSGFVRGLANAGNETSLCGHCYAQAWPKGPMFPGKAEYLDHRYDNHLVRFFNAPGIRFDSMGRGYYNVASKLAKESDFDAIVTYNPYPWHAAAARRLRREFGLPWICLNLDFEDVGQGWETFLKQAGDADGHVFLSYGGYEEAPVTSKLHLDSGVDYLPDSFGPRQSGEVFNLVYLGGLSEANGLEVLMHLPERIPHPHVRFIYGGKGYARVNEQLKRLAELDSRVNFRGFVNDDEVEDLFDQADVFLNPRDPNQVLNEMVFPSKIMHYLLTGKTVVSTWTKGLEESYRDLMLISEGAEIKDFADTLTLAINEVQQDRDLRAIRIRKFLEGSRLWSHQAERFCTFTEDICSNRHAGLSG